MDFKIEKKGYKKSEVDEYIFNLVRNYEQSLAQQKQLLEDLKLKLSESERKNKVYKDKESLVSKAITSAVAKADEIDKLAQLKYTREMEQLKAFHDKWLSYYDRILKKYPLSDELLSVARFNEEMNRILQKAGQNGDVAADSSQSADEVQESEFDSDINHVQETGDAPKKETRIGYVTVSTDEDEGEEEDDLFAADFDPVDRIRSFLTKDKPRRTKAKEDNAQSGELAATGSAPISDYADRSESGFSFEEALNPKEDLADIMKDLGLLMDD